MKRNRSATVVPSGAVRVMCAGDGYASPAPAVSNFNLLGGPTQGNDQTASCRSAGTLDEHIARSLAPDKVHADTRCGSPSSFYYENF
jgi:hypothetical protein